MLQDALILICSCECVFLVGMWPLGEFCKISFSPVAVSAEGFCGSGNCVKI